MAFFSVYDIGIHNTTPCSNKAEIGDIYRYITTSPEAQEATEGLRARLASGETEAAKAWKLSKFAAATFAGTFPNGRAAGKLEAYSGYLCLDFDHVGDVERARRRLASHPRCVPVLLFTSPSGDGVKAVYRIDGGDTFGGWFARLSFTLSIDLHLDTDQSGKDVSRACFLPYDPAAIWQPEAAVAAPYSLPEPPPSVRRVQPSRVQPYTWTASGDAKYEAARRCCERARAAGIDVTATYNEWVAVGLSLASFGERGRELFHVVSCNHPHYNYQEADRQFTACLRSRLAKSIEPFFEAVKHYGIMAKGGTK